MKLWQETQHELLSLQLGEQHVLKIQLHVQSLLLVEAGLRLYSLQLHVTALWIAALQGAMNVVCM